MNAPVMTVSARPADAQTRRLLVRMNGTFFHCLGAAVLLESARASSGEAGSRSDENAASLRAYARAVWPEFAWERACAAMRCSAAVDHPATRAASTEHAVLFYRALACAADDTGLRDRLFAIAEAASGATRTQRGSPLACLRGLVAARAHARRCHDHFVRRAFELLQQHWTDVPPFAAATYDEFVARARALLEPHLVLRWPQRLALAPWTRRKAAKRAAAPTAIRRVAESGWRGSESASRAACALPPVAVLR